MVASGERWWGLLKSRSSRCCRDVRSVAVAAARFWLDERRSTEVLWWWPLEPEYRPDEDTRGSVHGTNKEVRERFHNGQGTVVVQICHNSNSFEAGKKVRFLIGKYTLSGLGKKTGKVKEGNCIKAKPTLISLVPTCLYTVYAACF